MHVRAIDNERFRKLLRSYPVGAVELLYDLYYKSLLSIASSLTHDPDASEDIVQDTFLHIWENKEKLSQGHERSIEHYLVRVVRNKSISFYKRRKHFNVDNLRFLNNPANRGENPIETNIIEGEIIQEIRHFISTFPKRERECLLMKIDEALTLDQIAFRLNVSRKAVERSLTSANKRLRKWGADK